MIFEHKNKRVFASNFEVALPRASKTNTSNGGEGNSMTTAHKAPTTT
jgi:hypothetical protein